MAVSLSASFFVTLRESVAIVFCNTEKLCRAKAAPNGEACKRCNIFHFCHLKVDNDFSYCIIQFSSVQFLDRLGRRSFLQEAIVSSSGMDRDVHSLMLSIQHDALPATELPTLQGALILQHSV